MPKGPFGFPRLTTLGPYVEKSSKQAPTREELNNRELSEYSVNEDTQEFSDCEPYTNIDIPVEFIIPVEEAQPVEIIQYPFESNQHIYDRISEVNKEYNNVFIGIHETDDEQAENIISNGFSKEMIGEKSVSMFGPRENAVFTWQFIWDIDGAEELSGVITIAPRTEVIVSDMSASVTVPKDDYVDKYTMSYPKYISCMRKLGPNSLITSEKDIIQDISDYYPAVL